MTPRVTAVVVTWNGAHLLGPCLDSLERQSEPVDLLVVDNASTDGTGALLAGHPRARVLTSGRNLGFAGGCALALRSVTTPYAVLLNNDAVAEPGFVAALLTAVAADPSRAAVTGKVLLAARFRADADGPVLLADGTRATPDPGGFDVVNSTGNEVRTDGSGQDRGWLARDSGPADGPEVFGFCGAAALLRMDAVRAAGSFDPRFFLYYEDTDLSWRLRLRGWTVGYAADAVVRHEHAASSSEGSPVHRFHDQRNRLLTLVKCAPARLAARAVLGALLTTASGVRREPPPWRRTRLRLRALASFARLLPHALRARREVGRAAVRTREEVARLLVPAQARAGYRGQPGAGRAGKT